MESVLESLRRHVLSLERVRWNSFPSSKSDWKLTRVPRSTKCKSIPASRGQTAWGSLAKSVRTGDASGAVGSGPKGRRHSLTKLADQPPPPAPTLAKAFSSQPAYASQPPTPVSRATPKFARSASLPKDAFGTAVALKLQHVGVSTRRASTEFGRVGV